MKAFVTGGTGFIGQHVVRKLVERGCEVYALARSVKGIAAMDQAGARVVRGDINNVDSMREAMRGSDIVYHIAGWYKLGSQDGYEAEAINVDGTRNVLNLARELDVPRIVYTSTIAVFGDTRGIIAGEDSPMPAGPFLTEYDRTKWMAHYQVAAPLAKQGVPIILAMPGGVYGPGDPSLIGELMKAYYHGLLPVVPGPEQTITYAHVEDIAEGLILAGEKGKPGEGYILAGPGLSMGEAVSLWAEILHRRPPLFSIPARFLKPFAPLTDALSAVVPLPPMLSRDALAVLDASYLGRSDKARRELGWHTRPLRQGMAETFDWIASTTGPVSPEQARQRQTAAIALTGAAVSGGIYLVYRLMKRRK